jgi:hypothetical protein
MTFDHLANGINDGLNVLFRHDPHEMPIGWRVGNELVGSEVIGESKVRDEHKLNAERDGGLSVSLMSGRSHRASTHVNQRRDRISQGDTLAYLRGSREALPGSPARPTLIGVSMPRPARSSCVCAVGLDRLHHRVNSVTIYAKSIVVKTFVNPAVTERGFDTYAADKSSLRVELKVNPRGDWNNIRLLRIGVSMGLPNHVETRRWYRLGPEQTSSDSRLTGKVGQYHKTIKELQTPYV